jgi:hypothetical protein
MLIIVMSMIATLGLGAGTWTAPAVCAMARDVACFRLK